MSKWEFNLTVMHPGGGTFQRTVIAEHNTYDCGLYHFYNGVFGDGHQTVACYPICCTIVESEIEIIEATRDKIKNEISKL
jgi:hypothetical protein